MLALAAANVVGVVLFGAVYAAAGARLMPQAAFALCLLVMFALVTSLWVRVEARHRSLAPVRRIGRAAAGLALVLIAVPVMILSPVFWLDRQLPADADFTRYVGPIMTIVLIALALVVLTNVAGLLVACVRGLLGVER